MEGPDILVDMAIVAFGCATLGPIGDRDAMRGLRRGGVTGTSADAMFEPARAAANTFSIIRGMVRCLTMTTLVVARQCWQVMIQQGLPEVVPCPKRSNAVAMAATIRLQATCLARLAGQRGEQ